MSSTSKTHASFAVVHFVCILYLFISGLKQLPLWAAVLSIGTLALNIFMGYRAAYRYGKEEARRTAGEVEGGEGVKAGVLLGSFKMCCIGCLRGSGCIG
jgi:hypothetical protein